MSPSGIRTEVHEKEGPWGILDLLDSHLKLCLKDSELPQPVSVSQHHGSQTVDYLHRVHKHGRHKVEEDVIAIGSLGLFWDERKNRR